ncbi:hypothetical protein DFJ74DRAFT_655418 [Hyaloraphidium curvatum]|nr:hypothetical protein DFJ74DRAFT_655418 [Hyaloraphidium curvatum]
MSAPDGPGGDMSGGDEGLGAPEQHVDNVASAGGESRAGGEQEPADMAAAPLDLDDLQAEAEALNEQSRTFKKRVPIRESPVDNVAGLDDVPSVVEPVPEPVVEPEDVHASAADERSATPVTGIGLGDSDAGSRHALEDSPANAFLSPPDVDSRRDASESVPTEASADGDMAAEDENDEDAEPLLKYSRLSGTLGNVLAKDNVSCICVSDRFLVVGTHGGHIHILDLTGNDIKRFRAHSASVTEISIDESADYLASSSDDGRVVVNSVFFAESTAYDFRRPVKAVALEPGYAKSSARTIISGGRNEQLILSSKNWFGATSNTTLHSGEGIVFTVKWRGSLVAWANERGVQLYDMSTSRRLGHVKRRRGSPRADLFRPHLFWKTDRELLIGWANSVTVVGIKDVTESSPAASGRSTPSRSLGVASAVGLDKVAKSTDLVPTIKSSFKTDYVVCGIAPFQHKGKELLVLLTVDVDAGALSSPDVLPASMPRPTGATETRPGNRPPEIRVVDYEGREVANDVLANVVGHEIYQPNDYRLDYLDFDQTYYLVSPKDIIVARPRDMADHIEWLLERQKYAEALHAAESAGDDYSVKGRLKVDDILEIGQKYLQALVAQGNFDEAASLCPKILRQDPVLWEQWVFTFAEAGQVAHLAPYMPTAKPLLAQKCYDAVMMFAVENDRTLLLRLARAWPPTCYDLRTLLSAAEEALRREPGDLVLMEAAMELYGHANNWIAYARLALGLGSPNALGSITRHNLLHGLDPAMLKLLFEYDQRLLDTDAALAERIEEELLQEEKAEGGQLEPLSIKSPLGRIRAATLCPAVQLLVASTEQVPPAVVVDAMKDYSGFLHIYLDALWKAERPRRDLRLEGSAYHNLQVELYAEYDPLRLLDFLRASNGYSVSVAYEVCQQRDMVPEMVFLLGKMGDNKKALALIIERMADVRGAIAFAKDQGDPALWEDLVTYSMDKPPFILGLLENVGTSMLDPADVVRRIPDGLPVMGLKGAVLRLLEDYGAQALLREGCGKIQEADTLGLLEALVSLQMRGLLVAEPSSVVCSVCGLPIVSAGAGGEVSDEAAIVFDCRDWFHSGCLLSSAGSGPSKQDSYLADSREDYLQSVRRRLRSIYAGSERMLGDSEEPDEGLRTLRGSESYRIRRRLARLALACLLCEGSGRASGKLLKTDADIRSEPVAAFG